MAELITQAEYARRRGVAKSAVARAVAEQRIRLFDGKIDPEVADIQWAKNTRARADSTRKSLPPSASGTGQLPTATASAEAPGYSDHRSRREAAEADMAVLESQRKAGRLMDVEPAERAVFDAFRALRDANFAAVRSAAPMVLGLTEVREIQHLLEDALRQAFTDFETRMRQRLQEIART